MQENLLKRQLGELTKQGSDSAITPELRDIGKIVQKQQQENNQEEQDKTRMLPGPTDSSYDILTSTKRAIEKSKTYKDIPMEFSKRFDKLSSASVQFVYVLTNENQEESEKVNKLTLSLKTIVLNLKQLFEIFHSFANTKFDVLEKTKLLKCSSELQLAVQNIIQGVKGRSNALPQFRQRAEEKLIYFTQILIASVWNVHVASDILSNEMLESDVREFGSVIKEIMSNALGQSSNQSFTEIQCYSKMQSIFILKCLNCKIIEIYHSEIQEKFTDIGINLIKGTKGILIAADSVKKNQNSNHRETLAKLAKLILFNINKISEIIQNEQHKFIEMYNFLNEQIEYDIIFSSLKQLKDEMKKYFSSSREFHNEEIEMKNEIFTLCETTEILYKYLQPDSFSKFEIISSSRKIGISIDIISKCALSFLGDAASELLENYLISCLRNCIYFSNQLKIISASISVSYPITTKIMLPITIRFLSFCIISVLEAVDTCVTIFDNPIDFEMDAILNQLPTGDDDSPFPSDDLSSLLNDNNKEEIIASMQTIRSTKHSIPKSTTGAQAHLHHPVPDKKPKNNSNMATLRQPRKGAPLRSIEPSQSDSMAELDALVHIDRASTANVSEASSMDPLDELDALVHVDRAPTANVSTLSSNPPVSLDPLDELDALVNIGGNSSTFISNITPKQYNVPVQASSGNNMNDDPLDELDALVNIDRNQPSQPSQPPKSSQSFNSFGNNHGNSDPLDELDALVNIDRNQPSQPPQAARSFGSNNYNNNSSFNEDPLDELDALVNLDRQPPGTQQMRNPVSFSNTQTSDPLDELDALVNIDRNQPSTSQPNSRAPQPRSFEANRNLSNSNTLDPLDELDALVNIDRNQPSQPPKSSQSFNSFGNNHGNSSNFDPLDELDALVNIDRNQPSQPPKSSQSFNSFGNNHGNSSNFDPLDELDALVNIDRNQPSTSQSFNSFGNNQSSSFNGDPLDELDALVNLDRQPLNTPQMRNPASFSVEQDFIDPLDELDALVNISSSSNSVNTLRRTEITAEKDPLQELEDLVNL